MNFKEFFNKGFLKDIPIKDFKGNILVQLNHVYNQRGCQTSFFMFHS